MGRVGEKQRDWTVESSCRLVMLHCDGAILPPFRQFDDRIAAKSTRADPGSPQLGVSPEFRLRPSLSGAMLSANDTYEVPALVSPEFRLRPSLSA